MTAIIVLCLVLVLLVQVAILVVVVQVSRDVVTVGMALAELQMIVYEGGDDPGPGEPVTPERTQWNPGVVVPYRRRGAA